MSENEIKPVVFDGSELRHGCVQRPKRWSGDTHDDLGGSVDEAATDALMAAAADAIDRLTAERDAAERQRDGYMEQHCRDSAELRAVCAERDEAQRKLSVAVAEKDLAVAEVAADTDRINWFYCTQRIRAVVTFPNCDAERWRAAVDAARAEGGV